MAKKLLFSVTAKDCRWDYYKGSGAGGQKRNKTENCVRCTHRASGAVGKSEDGRSKHHNKMKAFERMANTNEFKAWHKIESMRRMGQLVQLEEEINRQMQMNTKVEIPALNNKGKPTWKKADDLSITARDVQDLKDLK